MIQTLVAAALNNRFVVLSIALLLFICGVIAFKTLPVEAYPDVANTWVQVITNGPAKPRNRLSNR
jgi:cobalt-zinc-cadmium resistance protein CzcA